MQALILGHVLESEANRSQTIKDYVEKLRPPERHLLITATDLQKALLGPSATLTIRIRHF